MQKTTATQFSLKSFHEIRAKASQVHFSDSALSYFSMESETEMQNSLARCVLKVHTGPCRHWNTTSLCWNTDYSFWQRKKRDSHWRLFFLLLFWSRIGQPSDNISWLNCSLLTHLKWLLGRTELFGCLLTRLDVIRQALKNLMSERNQQISFLRSRNYL